MAEFLEVHHFEPLVGKTVRFGGIPFVMSLLKIVKGQKFVADAKRDPFILIFRCARGREYMREGTYDCAFDEGPTHTIHIAPVHTVEPEWQDYQAVFN
jgi:hypothetical protein